MLNHQSGIPEDQSGDELPPSSTRITISELTPELTIEESNELTKVTAEIIEEEDRKVAEAAYAADDAYNYIAQIETELYGAARTIRPEVELVTQVRLGTKKLIQQAITNVQEFNYSEEDEKELEELLADAAEPTPSRKDNEEIPESRLRRRIARINLNRQYRDSAANLSRTPGSIFVHNPVVEQHNVRVVRRDVTGLTRSSRTRYQPFERSERLAADSSRGRRRYTRVETAGPNYPFPRRPRAPSPYPNVRQVRALEWLHREEEEVAVQVVAPTISFVADPLRPQRPSSIRGNTYRAPSPSPPPCAPPPSPVLSAATNTFEAAPRISFGTEPPRPQRPHLVRQRTYRAPSPAPSPPSPAPRAPPPSPTGFTATDYPETEEDDELSLGGLYRFDSLNEVLAGPPQLDVNDFVNFHPEEDSEDDDVSVRTGQVYAFQLPLDFGGDDRVEFAFKDCCMGKYRVIRGRRFRSWARRLFSSRRTSGL